VEVRGKTMSSNRGLLQVVFAVALPVIRWREDTFTYHLLQVVETLATSYMPMLSVGTPTESQSSPWLGSQP
jgi:hypothetical protein